MPKIIVETLELDSNKLTEFVQPDFLEVTGDISLSYNQLKRIKLQSFMRGSLWCEHNQFENLEGFPSSIEGHCSLDNNKLTTLKGTLNRVGRVLDVSRNYLKTPDDLEGGPMYASGVTIDGNRGKFTKEEVRAKIDGDGEVITGW